MKRTDWKLRFLQVVDAIEETDHYLVEWVQLADSAQIECVIYARRDRGLAVSGKLTTWRDAFHFADGWFKGWQAAKSL